MNYGLFLERFLNAAHYLTFHTIYKMRSVRINSDDRLHICLLGTQILIIKLAVSLDPISRLYGILDGTIINFPIMYNFYDSVK